MTFGKWLLEKREASDLTQKDVADRVGVSVSYISALERDEPNAKDGSPRRPRIEKVDSLAKALGANLDEAREAAGYAGRKLKRTIDIEGTLRVSLLKSDISDKDWEEYERAVRYAIGQANRIIDESK